MERANSTPDFSNGCPVSPSAVREMDGSSKESPKIEVGCVTTGSLLNAAGRREGKNTLANASCSVSPVC